MTRKKTASKPAANVVATTRAEPGSRKDWAELEVVGPDDVTPMAHVVSVDTEAGEMTRYKADVKGKLLTDGGALILETVKGDFTIRKRA